MSLEQDLENARSIFVGQAFTVSLRNVNLKSRSTKDGMVYKFEAEITEDDFDALRAVDLTGSLFEAEMQCVECGKPEAKGGSLSKWAGILCDDPKFWAWCGLHTSSEARDYLCHRCNIGSRRELDHNPKAARVFREQIMAPFAAWKGSQ